MYKCDNSWHYNYISITLKNTDMKARIEKKIKLKQLPLIRDVRHLSSWESVSQFSFKVWVLTMQLQQQQQLKLFFALSILTFTKVKASEWQQSYWTSNRFTSYISVKLPALIFPCGGGHWGYYCSSLSTTYRGSLIIGISRSKKSSPRIEIPIIEELLL